MKVAFFSAQKFEIELFDQINQDQFDNRHQLHYFEVHLNQNTAAIVDQFPAVCCFVNDNIHTAVLQQLATRGVKLIALRSAGFNHVDLKTADELGLIVARVPNYSPYAVAEHACALVLGLNRKIHRAFNRVREHDFSLHGLLGFDLHGKTVGVVGTGQIGAKFCHIMQGFGCRILAYDVAHNPDCLALGVEYVSLNELLCSSHIISLHCPLTPETHHLIDTNAFAQMQPNVMLINTSRGALVDTHAAIEALKSGKLGYLGLDVYEEEEKLFFEDLSDRIIQDDIFARLQTFPNVIITGHQAFFTQEALHNIALTTLTNIDNFEQGKLTDETVCHHAQFYGN